MRKPTSPSPASREAALALVRTAMIEKKLTQAELADAADCHEKTIQNLVNGRKVRDQTLFDVCMVLGLDYEEIKTAWDGKPATAAVNEMKGAGGLMAPVYMGAYTEAAVDQYIASFLTVRPSFSAPETIVAYRTEITWDPDWPSLLFQEMGRPDPQFSHRGRVYIPAASSFLHLVSLTKGAMRTVLVSQIDQTGRMRGLITTLHKSGPTLVPVAAPILLQRIEGETGHALGEIRPPDPAYTTYRAWLEEAANEGYVRLVR